MSKAHAKLSASGSAMWINCPGSIRAEEVCGIKDKKSDYAKYGTKGHELAELCLTQQKDASEFIGKFLPECNEEPVDNEMAEYVQIYLDYVRQFKGAIMVEQRVDFSPWAKDGFGTSDTIIINDDTLTIVDLKMGKGVRVDAEDNTQGILYALGAINDFGGILDIKTVTIHIVQPRLDHVSEWSLTYDELMKWGERIKQAADLALTEDAPRNAGEKQCQWCKAKGTCPELYKQAELALSCQFDDLSLTNPDQLSDEQLQNALNAKKLILRWLDAVEDVVSDRLLNGGTLEGFKVVEGRSNRAWVDEQVAATHLIEALGSELYTRKIITPTQAEKLLGKKNAALLDGLVTKPQGAPTVVPVSDKRQSITVSAADFD